MLRTTHRWIGCEMKGELDPYEQHRHKMHLVQESQGAEMRRMIQDLDEWVETQIQVAVMWENWGMLSHPSEHEGLEL